MSEKADFGVVGLGVMGASLALNIEEKGHRVALLDLDPAKAKQIIESAPSAKLVATKDVAEFTQSLRVPRRILLMVPAGKPVDASLESLAPHLQQGDVVIDGGNEFYTKTERRQAEWLTKGIHLIGMGVSGGQEGARRGPSMMPGGDEKAYREVEPVLKAVAAQVSDGACVTYIGPGGSGHFVKMVHNGIEYGDMQLIAEIYDLLKNACGLSNTELADIFTDWNKGDLESFLIEITADILRKPDDRGTGSLVDAILDTAKMKGTGSWTVKEGAELASAIPTIASSVEARLMSGQKPLRQKAASILAGPNPSAAGRPSDVELWVQDARDALYAAKVCSYAQGMDLLRRASEERSWNLNLAEISRIWKAGCIIRARLLGTLQTAFSQDSQLPNLLMSAELAKSLSSRQDGWRRTLSRCVEHGISAPSMMSSLSYYDGLRRERLPANLTQAQRDYFGAHTYQRIDAEGVFHTDW